LAILVGLFAQSGSEAMKRMISMPQSVRLRGSFNPSPGPQFIHATPLSGVAFLGRSSGRLMTIV
jgi:hypothetical protein